MADVRMRVNGREYAGWKSVRVTRGIEAVAGKFELEVSDRWSNQSAPWPISEEDECTILLDGQIVIVGYVDRRERSYNATTHTIRVEGRDKTGDLVDCSALLKNWEFKGLPLLTLAQRIAEPFGIGVAFQPGVAPPPTPARLSVDPGDTAFDVIDRACRLAGLLPVSDGDGGLMLARAGSYRTVTDLVEGQNILAGSSSFDASGRFARYVVLGQHSGTDELSGETAASVKGEATDANVRRAARVRVVRAEGNVTAAQAKTRAQWEATVSATRGDSVAITVQGWTQGNGVLWPANGFVGVRAPFLGVDGTMLITQVTYSLDDQGGTVTDLTLRRPDAFAPEPVVSKETTGLWQEIKAGV